MCNSCPPPGRHSNPLPGMFAALIVIVLLIGLAVHVDRNPAPCPQQNSEGVP